MSICSHQISRRQSTLHTTLSLAMVVNSFASSTMLLLSLLGVASMVDAAKFNPMETMFQPKQRPSATTNANQESVVENATFEQGQASPKQFIPPRQDHMAPTPEERQAERMARRERNEQRRAKIQEAMNRVQPTSSGVERLSQEEFEDMQKKHPEFRKLWGGGNSNNHMIQYADPGDDYDMWQQAYRMLGGFIDCDHQKSQGSGDHNGQGNGNAGNNGACSRWLMWASVSRTELLGKGDSACSF